MAKRKYRIAYGGHYIPNPDFKVDPVSGQPVGEGESHIYAESPSVIELDEERAKQFTLSFFGQPAKLVLVSDSAGVPEINTGSSQPPSPPSVKSPPSVASKG